MQTYCQTSIPERQISLTFRSTERNNYKIKEEI